jgi:flagellar biosynthesis protein FlhG
MTKILPVASGKGGVGKSIFVANLGVALAARGKTVILIDLDLGGSNLHSCLGIKNRYSGLGSFIYKKEKSLEALLVETEIERLYLIPGDSLLPGTANLPFSMKQKIIRGIDRLIADYIILDLSAGSTNTIIDFFLLSFSGILITIPEATAILNLYTFFKTALYRLLHQSFPAKSEERRIIHDFIGNRIEGSDLSFANLITNISSFNQESGTLAEKQIAAFFPAVVINMAQSDQDLAIVRNLRDISRKNMGCELEYIGFLPMEEGIHRSMIQRLPFFLSEPGSRFSRSIDLVARKLIATAQISTPRLPIDNEDLAELSNTIF